MSSKDGEEKHELNVELIGESLEFCHGYECATIAEIMDNDDVKVIGWTLLHTANLKRFATMCKIYEYAMLHRPATWEGLSHVKFTRSQRIPIVKE